MKRIYLILFVIGSLLAFYIQDYFEYSFDTKAKTQGKRSMAKVNGMYNAIIETYMTTAQKDLENLLSNQDVMKKLVAFKYATPHEKNILRGRLYRLLYKQYDKMKELHIRQFHFHTHKGESLLRFHLPYESGDSLLDLRTTIYKANTLLESTSGFEGGRIYPGYRYVFPIVFENVHLGSIEFSISFEGIEEKLKKLMPNHTFQLLMTKESSIDRVFKWHQSFFSESIWHQKYYVESSSLSSVTKHNEHNVFSRIVSYNSNIEALMEQEKSFSSLVFTIDGGYLLDFIAFKNTDNKHAGYIVSLSKHENILKLKKETQLYTIISIVLLAILLLLIALLINKFYELRSSRKTLKELNLSLKKSNTQLERFIDLQQNIVILTNGKEFQFANKRFYTFFGYANLEAFKKDYDCLCKLFLVNQHFFSLERVKEDEKHWIDSLLNLPERNRIVSMLDTHKTPHAFSVGINTFDEKTYVVNFSDISDTMKEKLQFEKQAIRDSLTGAYNRTYFQNSINRIRASYQENNLNTGIIFFDIDHFKHINDLYGHTTGDQVLRELTTLTQHNLRKEDSLIRWGGEEFIVVIGVTNLDSALKIAEHLRKTIETHQFNNIKTLTCSFGVAIGDNHTPVDSLISKADSKLYEAKNSGRNEVCSD